MYLIKSEETGKMIASKRRSKAKNFKEWWQTRIGGMDGPFGVVVFFGSMLAICLAPTEFMDKWGWPVIIALLLIPYVVILPVIFFANFHEIFKGPRKKEAQRHDENNRK